MPLDPSQPADDFDIPAFPGYLRGVWINNILPATVPCQFSLWQVGAVVASTNAGQEVVISATPGLPITVLKVVARVKVASSTGDIGVDVAVNGASILGGVIPIPAGLLKSLDVVPTNQQLHNGDLLTMSCTTPGNGAQGLSVHLLCMARITYP